MFKCLHSVSSLLPHAPPMVLLDDIVGKEEREASALVTIHANSVFFLEGKGVPSY
ncbi:MAG TPA: 3-hydroxylacyl-ACP dehydratase, partial [Rhodospirillaceae bacterium]|nr:3-hydroxylacyl-ACP dehydratase [Rhodospirillaceae bacterium]